MAARKWTKEQRKSQAERIKLWQPWKDTTGPKTIIGKARSSANAYKGGLNEKIKQLRMALIEQKKALRYLK